MNPPSQQVILGNRKQPPSDPERFVIQKIPDENLWGSKVRRSMGIVQIIGGGISFVFSIVVIALPSSSSTFDSVDYAGWGIWTGVFAVVTGFMGFFSLEKICMVIAYMVTSTITAILFGGCFIYAVFGTLITRDGPRGEANMAMYIIICIVSFILSACSIIGTSFTCGALSFVTQSQQTVNYTTQTLPKQYVQASQPYQVTTAQSEITLQTTTGSTNGAFVSPAM